MTESINFMECKKKIEELESRLMIYEQKITPKTIQFDITLSDNWMFPIDKENDKSPYYLMVSDSLTSNEPVDRGNAENSYAFAYGLINTICANEAITEITEELFNEMYNSNNIYMTLITEEGKNLILNLLNRNYNMNIDFILPGDNWTHSYGINRANIHREGDGFIIRFVTTPRAENIIKANGKYTIKITYT